MWPAITGILAAVELLIAADSAFPQPARFWISTSNFAASGPEAPFTGGIDGSSRYLHVWAQPMPGKVLQNFSLNLVTANQPVVEFANESIIVHNSLINNARRFHFVHDSTSGLLSTPVSPDRINNIQGFTVAESVPATIDGITYTGIGGASCQPADPFCDNDAPNGPAWLVASVAYNVVAPTGTADFYLEVGVNGISHAGDVQGSADTSVVFGNGSGPIYNANTDRQSHSLPGETSDLVVDAAPAAVPAHWMSTGGEWTDINKWSTGALPSWTNDVVFGAGLGTHEINISGSQIANSTTMDGGRLHLRDGASLSSNVVVNQGGAVSGSGWIGDDLVLYGRLSVASSEPLRVSGAVSLNGATFDLLSSYSQAPNTTTSVVILEAVGEIEGIFSLPTNSELRPGLFLESITYSPSSHPRTVTLQLRSEGVELLGDANGDSHVDAADYVVLRKNGVTSEQLAIWQGSFGQSAGNVSPLNGGEVPEPSAVAWVVFIACWMATIRQKVCHSATPKLGSVAALLLIWVFASRTSAQTTPFTPMAGDIQTMFDRTGPFSSNTQASSAAYTNIPGGKQLDITWSTGTPTIHETFTRVAATQQFPENNGDGDGGDLQAFDGASWRILSDTPIAVKPFTQSWDNFNFQEGSQPSTGCGVGTFCIPANVPTIVSINWNQVTGTFPVSDRTNVNLLGFQIFGPDLAQNGATAHSTVEITSVLDPVNAIIGSASETVVESRAGGQNFAWYSEDGGGFPNSWSNSTAKSTVAGVTPGIGSRFNSNAAFGGASTWFQVSPTLPTEGGVYEVYATTTTASGSITATSNITTTGGRGLPSSTTAFSTTESGNKWGLVGVLSLDQGVNNPIVRFEESMHSNRFYADGILFAEVPMSTPAIVTNWTNASGGTFAMASNWDGGVAPTTRYAPAFNLPGTYTVSFGARAFNRELNVNEGDVTFNLQGNEYHVISHVTLFDSTLRITNGRFVQSKLENWDGLVVGQGFGNVGRFVAEGPNTVVEIARGTWLGNGGGTGYLDVLNGAHFIGPMVGNGLYGGPANEPSTAHIVVSGSGSRIDAPTSLNAGSLLISEGGVVDSKFTFNFLGIDNGVIGAATITGSGSLWTNIDRLTVGGVYHTDTSGHGILNIADGGKVESAVLVVGNRSLSRGEVSVSGLGSELHAAYMFFGDDGQGEALVSGGGKIVTGAGHAAIGSTENGEGIVTLQSQSIWDSTGPLFIGDGGEGLLTIESSSSVISGGGTIGRLSTGLGEVIAQGAGSSWTVNGELNVGDQGQGSLSVVGGAQVTSSQSAYVGRLLGAHGHVEVSGSGSQLNVTGDLRIGSGGTGFVNVSNQGIVSTTGTLRALAGGTLGGNGTVDGDVLNNGGRVRPGNSPGILHIDGDYTQTSTGVLEIELAGVSTAGTDYDLLQVTGTATLGGQLELKLLDGFVPSLNDGIQFITAGTVAPDKFDSLYAPTLAAAAPNLAVRLDYSATDVQAHFVVPSADIQFDGQVAAPEWSDPDTWTTDTVPDSVNVITVQNLTGSAQHVNVLSESAFAHDLTITGGVAPLTVSVQNGNNLSATVETTVNNQGVLELNTGHLISPLVAIESGGALQGNGVVTGDVKVGIDNGPQKATFSPGFSVGHIDLTGSYEQGSNGTLQIDVEGTADGSFDSIDVTGTVKVGGTLVYDASILGSTTAGSTFEFVTADSVTGEFDFVDTVGGEFWIRTIYEEGGGGGGSLSGEVCDPGDMDCDQQIVGDDDDIEIFAAAIRDVEKFLDNPEYGNTIASADLDGWTPGSVHFGDDNLDFDDIDDFVRLHSGGGSGSETYLKVLEAIENYGTVPEPTSAVLMLLGMCSVASVRRCRTI